MPREDRRALHRGVETHAGGAEYGPEAGPRARPGTLPGALVQPRGSARAPHRVPLGGRQRRSVEPGEPLRRASPARRAHGAAAGVGDGARSAPVGAGRRHRRTAGRRDWVGAGRLRLNGPSGSLGGAGLVAPPALTGLREEVDRIVVLVPPGQRILVVHLDAGPVVLG